MKYALLLLFLVACAPAVDVSTQPVHEIDTKPAAVPVQPVSEPELKAKVIPTETIEEPSPEPFVEEDCQSLCRGSCERSAQNACTQSERSQCKANCYNDIIDPSACTQACTYLSSPSFCKQKMTEFCTSQCVSYCN